MVMKLRPEELYKCCDLSIFRFDTTDDIGKFEGTIGQERALRSLDFGLGLISKGFNIYVLGESGTGKMRTIRTLLNERASKESVPSDWCYVYNFKDPDNPLAVSLDPGKGVVFQKDMDTLIKNLRIEIPKAFESKEYEKQRSKILEEFQQKQKSLFTSLEEDAMAKGFAIRKAVTGLLIVPIKKNGEPLTEEEFAALDEKTRKKVEEIGKMLQEKLDDVVRAVREAEKLVKDMLSRLEREIALAAVGHFIEELKEKYKGYEKIVAYLDAVKEDILSHLDDFKITEEQAPPLPFMKMPKPEVSFVRYTVNVIVNNADCKGAPVVFESNPTYLNLFGRIEYKVQYGMALTDFSMIKAGSLHRANGGYIVINALDLLRNIFSYDALKRSIKNKEIKIEDVWEQYRLLSTTALKPEPIPLDVKVILVGNPYLYYLLYNLDEEYKELFKVKADFDSRMPRTNENIEKYAFFVASCQKEENLLPFDRSGVAKIVEYGSRLAEHQDKLSTKFSYIADIIREAHYWAKNAGSNIVKAEHVTKAIEEKIYRANRIEERIREMILEDTLIVETDGEKVGQVNGLAVLDLGDYSFGKPSRITARTYTGKAGVVNIERETKMSGKIHEKAIMIISSYLGSKYATKRPISLSASITFEQLYEMVEGDSATCAELYALLSSISGVPLKQNIAVTGSMDQNGDVQPIGGVNEKIEGFFDLCKVRGLDGHGVIIPKRNIKHLMLRQEVVDAVKDNKFFIYPIEKMEEGLEILTGMSAGVQREDGTYPEGTINYLVMKRLEEISEALEKKKEKEEEKAAEKKEGDNNANNK
ncbi:ATP-dependent protease [Dissulfurispira thermophila]|uniref:endopeptidase La n=2 Tax=root TaxID=1 RepID=A0A7G1H2S1_9BACT|nr:ATP-binding protein [Dissulfurispira thermophila]BCB96978.1 ATP-dependent protease [Dissulfurispira thermophila]